MGLDPRQSLLGREDAHDLIRAIEERRPHADLRPMADRVFLRLVLLDNAIAASGADLRQGVETGEMHRRAKSRDAARKRAERRAGRPDGDGPDDGSAALAA